MALQKIQLGNSSYETQQGETEVELGGTLAGRTWSVPLVLQEADDETALVELFQGDPVPMTLQDGTIVPSVIVQPAEIVQAEYPFVTTVTVVELI